MKIIFDENLATEYELSIGQFFEHVTTGSLVASKTIQVGKGETIPDLSGMQGRTSFTTVSIVDDESHSYTILGNYDKITDFSTSAFAEEEIFTYSMTLE